MRALDVRLAVLAGALLVCLSQAAPVRAECNHPGTEGLSRLLSSPARDLDKKQASEPAAPSRPPCLPGMSCWPGRSLPMPSPTTSTVERVDIIMPLHTPVDTGENFRFSLDVSSFYSHLPTDAPEPPPRGR